MWSQNYPVVATLFVKSTYSLRWQDYATNTDMLRLSLILRDQSKSDLDVYLYFTIKGLGWSISTNPSFVPSQKIRLQNGVPQLLNGPDLAEYFSPNNVLVEGLPPELVRQGGTFPEGYCTLEVYAHEGFRDRQVSNTGRFDFAVFALKPPLLIAPANSDVLRSIVPQRVLFQWMPQSPIVRLTGEVPLYRLDLWEVPTGQDPNAIAQNQATVLWSTNISTTSAIMGSDANLQLEEGKTYAWRVTLNKAGQDSPVDNEGKSEVWSFRWGGSCLPPEPVVLRDWGGGVKFQLFS